MNFIVNIIGALLGAATYLLGMIAMNTLHVFKKEKIAYPIICFFVILVMGYKNMNITVHFIMVLSFIYSFIIHTKKIDVEDILMIFMCGFYWEVSFWISKTLTYVIRINSLFEKALLYLVVLIFFMLIFKVIFHIVKLKSVTFEKNIIKGIHTKTYMIALIICDICMLIINMYMISANADSIKKIIYFLTALMNFFILINIITENLMIMNLSKTMKDKEDQYLKLKEYTEVIESMSSDIKKFKHDYTNILKTLDYYIENDDFEALKKYYHKELFPESSKIVKKDSNILYLKNIKNLSLKGILFSKISEAKNENIEIMLDVREEIGEFKINIIDLCRIVGILMDNAIEGTRELDSKKIQIGIIEMDDEKIIVIENSCQLELPPIYKMFEEGFSTKGSERGMGLSIVKGIADKYDNVFINTEVDGNIFRQEIVVSDKIR